MTERDFVGNVNLKTLSSIAQCNKLITKQPYPTTCINNCFQCGKSGPNLFTLVQKNNPINLFKNLCYIKKCNI